MDKKNEGTFEDLVAKYKRAFYNDASLIKESFDVAIPLTLKNNNNVINFISGPMKKEQYVNQFSRIKDGVGIPEVFAFVDVDYFNLPNLILNKEDILKFVSGGYGYAEEKI